MERIRKGSDLRKKKVGVTEHPTKYSHTKLPQRSSALYFVEFRLGPIRKPLMGVMDFFWNIMHYATANKHNFDLLTILILNLV